MAAAQYEIILRGPLGPRLATAIDGFEVTSNVPEGTRLVGWVADQAALHGTLRRISDLGLELVGVRELA